jgi:hypothetical protein
LQKARKTQLHLFGLVSDGGVHSHQEHLYALLKAAKQQGVEKVFVHAFMDGRDTLPTSGAGYLAALEQKMREFGGKLASVSGRYYAMDRDRRWEREKKAFDAMVKGQAEGGAYKDAVARVKELYNNGTTDEFIVPFVVTDEHGKPNGLIRDEDVCLMFNFRADRARQITRVLARNSGLSKEAGRELPSWEELDATIPRSEIPSGLHYVCMTQYDKNFTLPMIILPESMENLLADVMAQANLRNLRVAETEKYAHVTYFFNGGIEKPFPGEDRILIPSQKVATYDLAPEMSAAGIADTVVKAVNDTAFDVVVVNFANADMVGHSGTAGADDQSGRDGGCVPGPDLSGDEAAGRRRLADHRGSRQRGADGRSGYGRAAHRAYDQSGAVHFCERGCEAVFDAAGWIAPRYFADDPGAAQPCGAEADDGRGSAGQKQAVGNREQGIEKRRARSGIECLGRARCVLGDDRPRARSHLRSLRESASRESPGGPRSLVCCTMARGGGVLTQPAGARACMGITTSADEGRFFKRRRPARCEKP